ncbi:MAG: YgiT-type zinc finger protein [Candidatus Sumerlaeota bacterium]|nr:YgiT-type zinc finger protein [Candidatus Sumerlaeota bacterium]
MKCSIQGCPGEYENTTILHTVRHKNDVLVFNHVPAEVCSICGDTLLSTETVRHLDKLMRSKSKPEKVIPLFEYA